MATSNPLGIYSAIENMEVTFTLRGQLKTPAVKGLTELPNTISGTSGLPVRLLINVANNAEGQTMKVFTIGAAINGGAKYKVSWKITELMLALPQQHGTGLKDVAYDLMDYCGKYLDKVRENLNITASALVTDCSVEPGTYLYPATENGVAYYGVQCVWTIEEIVS